MDGAAIVDAVDDSGSDRGISDATRVAGALAAAPEFAGWAHLDLARLVPYITKTAVPSGAILCRRGDEAERAFCLLEGSVCYAGGSGRTITSGFVGHEAALNASTYLGDVVAVTNVTALVIPRSVLRDFGITLEGHTLYHSLLAHHIAPPDAAAVRSDTEPAQEAGEEHRPNRVKSIGWILALVIPALVLRFGQRLGLNWHQRDFVAALAVCLLMMSFNLTEQYAAALIAGLACLLLEVAPASVILSGFASDGFFMALSIFGLGAVLTASGLAERLILNILRLSPSSPFWYNTTILLTGVCLTPVLPSANTRVALMTPLVMETSRALDRKSGV